MCTWSLYLQGCGKQRVKECIHVLQDFTEKWVPDECAFRLFASHQLGLSSNLMLCCHSFVWSCAQQRSTYLSYNLGEVHCSDGISRGRGGGGRGRICCEEEPWSVGGFDEWLLSCYIRSVFATMRFHVAMQVARLSETHHAQMTVVWLLTWNIPFET